MDVPYVVQSHCIGCKDAFLRETEIERSLHLAADIITMKAGDEINSFLKPFADSPKLIAAPEPERLFSRSDRQIHRVAQISL